MPSLHRTHLNVKTRSEASLSLSCVYGFSITVCVSPTWFWSCVSGLFPHLINDTLVFQQGLSLAIALLDYICESMYCMRVRWHSPVWGVKFCGDTVLPRTKVFLMDNQAWNLKTLLWQDQPTNCPQEHRDILCASRKGFSKFDHYFEYLIFLCPPYSSLSLRTQSALLLLFSWLIICPLFTFPWPIHCASHLSFVKEP